MPAGALAQSLSNPRSWPMTRSFMHLDESEYEDLLRSEGASEHLIREELKQFRALKEKFQSKPRTNKQRRQEQPVAEHLDPFVEAEIRRIASVAADDVIKDMR